MYVDETNAAHRGSASPQLHFFSAMRLRLVRVADLKDRKDRTRISQGESTVPANPAYRSGPPR